MDHAKPTRPRLRQALGLLDDEPARAFGFGLLTLADGRLAASALDRLDRLAKGGDDATAAAAAVAAELGRLAGEATSLADLWQAAQQVAAVPRPGDVTWAEQQYRQALAALQAVAPQPTPAPAAADEAATVELRRTDLPDAPPFVTELAPPAYDPAGPFGLHRHHDDGHPEAIRHDDGDREHGHNPDGTVAWVAPPPVWEFAGDPATVHDFGPSRTAGLPVGTGHRHDGGRVELHHEGDRPHRHDPESGIVVWLDPDTLEPLGAHPIHRGSP